MTGGINLWGAPKDSQSKTNDDEKLRQDLEDRHIATFQQRTRVTIFRFLNTKQGQSEITLVADELDRLNVERMRAAKAAAGEKLVDENGVEITVEAVPEEMRKRATIHEIFRKFDEDGSDSIDRNELRILLDELQVPMTDDELSGLIQRLDSNGGEEIEFDEFYHWFVSEAESQKSKNKIGAAKNFLRDFAGYIGVPVRKDDGGIYKGFKRMVLEVEARNMIIDHAIFKAMEAVRKEFRIAHPPVFLCEKTDCGMSFASLKEKLEHQVRIGFSLCLNHFNLPKNVT